MSKCALCLFKTSDEAELNNLNWYICQNSKLTIWHRPKTSQIPILKEKFGLSTLVTLQCEREHLQDLSSICKKTGVFWLNIPLEGANLPYLKRKETKKLIRNGISEVLKILEKDNERILIHCAAGVHRTGVFGYSLFRMMGNDEEKAKSILSDLRILTFKGVGLHRLKYAEDEIISKEILNNI